jgi:hypothetical protein
MIIASRLAGPCNTQSHLINQLENVRIENPFGAIQNGVACIRQGGYFFQLVLLEASLWKDLQRLKDR